MAKDPCSDLARVITRLAMNVGERPEVRNLDDVVKVLGEHIPEITRDSLVASINEATTGRAAARSELGSKLDTLKREARRDVALRVSITELQRALERGEVPTTTPREPAAQAPAIATLTERRDAVLAALKKSDPAIRQRFERQIENLTDRLETGVTLPEPKVVTPLSREAMRLEFERDKLRRQVRHEIEALKPKSIWGAVVESSNVVRSVKTAFDLSALLFQGSVFALGHPIRTARGIPEILRAFGSEEASYRAAKEIEARPNAPLYAKAKLYLSSVGPEGLAKQEEVFLSRLAGKVPLVKASERAYVTTLNRIRADAFDALVNSRGGDVTLPEAQALANFVNVATGRGKLVGALERGADLANAVLFAPRNFVSRVQLLAGQPLYGGTLATRKAVLGEYARYLTGLAVVYGLAKAGGADIETDPRSSDFLKLRFGNTRLDPLSGISQILTFAGRMVTQESKSADGRITDLRNPKFGQRGTGDVIASFLRSKLAPLAGYAGELATGKDAIGNKITPLEATADLVAPMSFGDVYETMREQGVGKGTALSILAMWGIRVSTYSSDKGDRRTHFEKDVQELWDRMRR